MYVSKSKCILLCSLEQTQVLKEQHYMNLLFRIPFFNFMWTPQLCPIMVTSTLDRPQVKIYITRSLFWDRFNPPVARIPVFPLLIPVFPNDELQQEKD